MKSDKDYYQILGIQRDVSLEAVRIAYRIYAGKFHPDKHSGDVFFEERFKEVREAYDILSDAEKRAKYDIKKFGKSKVARRTDPHLYDDVGAAERPKPGRRLSIDISHIEIYLAIFYLINLVAWVMIKRISEQTSTGGRIWSLFLCGISALVMWLFISGLIDLRNHRYTGRRMLLVGYLLVSLMFGCIPLATNWLH